MAVQRSRALVLTSRCVLGEVFTIQGGADAPSPLRESIRTRLADRTLLPVDGRAWAGPATGKPCSVCREPIDAGIEYEIDRPRPLYAHLLCYVLWLDESNDLRVRRQRAHHRE